jgi:predicted CoA-binding protein
LNDGGLSVWDFASDKNPDVVVVGIGDYVTKEAMAAVEIIKKKIPDLRIRFVNMLRLQAACSCEDEYHPQIPDAEKYFTVDKPVLVNFHGYPETMKSIFFNLKNPSRFSVHGYIEEGGTTTPFDMQVRNRTDRYHLALELAAEAFKAHVIDEETHDQIAAEFTNALSAHRDYIIENGSDPEDIENWQWSSEPPMLLEATNRDRIDILKEARSIAFIGLSDKEDRHSNKVAKYFQELGYRIIPINPNLTEALGEPAYKSILDVPHDIHIDIVDIFRNPEEVVPHMKEVVERGGIKTVWLAEGANSHEAEEFAEDYGLTMVNNICIMDVSKAAAEGANN